MSDRTDDPGRPLRTRKAVLLVAAVVVLVIVVVLVLTLSGRGGSVTPTPSGSVSSTESPGASTAPPPSTAAPTSAGPTRSSSGKPTTAKPTGTASTTGNASPQATRSPVPINTKAEVKKGLSAAISKLEAVNGEANGPGEVAGPAIRFVLTLTNTSDAAVPLDTTVVNAYYSKAETPATQLEKPGGAALPASVKAGGKATGTFIYSIPRNQRSDVLITVDYSVDVNLIAFRGKAPR